METIELRVEINEEAMRELVWQALSPDALVITSAWNAALEQQYAAVGQPSDEYVLTGVSTVIENGSVFAELTYTKA